LFFPVVSWIFGQKHKEIELLTYFFIFLDGSKLATFYIYIECVSNEFFFFLKKMTGDFKIKDEGVNGR